MVFSHRLIPGLLNVMMFIVVHLYADVLVYLFLLFNLMMLLILIFYIECLLRNLVLFTKNYVANLPMIHKGISG